MLFQIFHFDGYHKTEVMRVKANDIEDVAEWLKETQFKKEHKHLVEIDLSCEIGFLNYSDCVLSVQKKACIKMQKDNFTNIEEMCEMCEGHNYYYEIIELIDPNPEDFNFKTIYGTNDFCDLTVDPIKKKPDWNPTLAGAWKKDPQKGCNELLRQTNKEIDILRKAGVLKK